MSSSRMTLLTLLFVLLFASIGQAARRVDRTPPAVSISSPTSGTAYTTAQAVTITASASDKQGVSKVEFYRNGVLQGADTSAPFSFAWNTGSVNNGIYSWTAKAYDAAGNSATSSAVSLTVDTTPPTAAINTPTSGTTYTAAQTVTVAAIASDNLGVSKVEFSRNGALHSTATVSPYTATWGFTSTDNGNHSWTAKAYDKAGLSTTSPVVSLAVNVPLPDPPPTVSLSSPASETTYTTAQTVSITATASDNIGVTKVEFYDGATLQGTDTTSPYSYAWGITCAINGTHSWTARAYDAAGSSTSSPVSVSVTIDCTPPTVPTGLTVSAVSCNQINLSWGASTDTGGAGLKGYNVYRNSAFVKQVSTTATADTGLAASTVYSYTVSAVDNAGNQSGVSNAAATNTSACSDTIAPTVSITSPASGANYTTAQTVTIHASATDNVGVSKVEFYDGATLKGTKTSAPYSYAWSISSATNGSHSWTAKAYDVAGNVQTSTAVSVTVNIAGLAGGTHIWSKEFGGTRVDQGNGIAVNAVNGDVVITGFYANTVDFGGGALPCTNTRNMVVAKYNVNGSHLWSQCVDPGTGLISPNAVAIDGSGNVVVIGNFSGTVPFGSQLLTSGGDTDVFVAKYAGNGALLWVQRDGNTLGDNGWGVAIDSQGDIVTTGGFQNPDTIFVTKYSPQGTVKWSRHFTGQGSNVGRGVAIDGQDNVIMTGSFYGTVQLQGGTLSLTSTTSFYPDVLLAKFDVAGNVQWARTVGAEGEERSAGIAVDVSTGEIAITGYFSGTSNFGLGSVTSTSYDCFLAKYDAAGRSLWSKVFGGSGNDVGYDVAIDQGSGDVFMAATFASTVSFGGQTFTSHGSTDIVIARYAGNTGAHIWSKAYGGIYGDTVKDLAVDDAGHLSAVGNFVQQIDFGGGALTGDAGYGDIFVLQLAP